jgi:MFS family permease
MNKTGKYKALGIALILIFILGPSWLSLVTLQMPDWPTLIFIFLAGAGYGGLVTVALLATISAVDHEHQAVITSATYAFRSTGSTIGVTIASAVYQNILKIQLWQKFGALPGATDKIQRIRDSLDELRHLPPDWKDGVLESYMDSLRAVFLTAMGIALLGLVTGSFMRQHILHTTLARR